MAREIKIWRCPICGDGRKAPKGMRLTDIRRFCLKCSQETGHLVERKTGIPAVPQVTQRHKYIVASNGLQPALTDEEHHQQHVVDEMPVLCNGCFQSHRGGMAKACGILDCECYCNKSTHAPRDLGKIVARVLAELGLPVDLLPAAVGDLAAESKEARLAFKLIRFDDKGTETRTREGRPLLLKEIHELAADLVAARTPVVVTRCSGCDQPVHASESDDLDRCPACVAAADKVIP